MLTTISIQKVKKNVSVFGYNEYFLKDFEFTELDSLETPIKKYRRHKIIKISNNRFFSCRIIFAV